MTEQQQQFRVGLFVLVAAAIAAALIFQFGELPSYLNKTYQVAVHFDDAPGLEPGTPVRQSGVLIGSVHDVALDEERGGVLVVLDVHEDRRLRSDAQPMLVTSLLGDASIEFSAGVQDDYIPPDRIVEGIVPPDPMKVVLEMEQDVSKTLSTFAATSDEWRKLAQNMNTLMETRQGSLDEVIERAALALESLTQTMDAARQTLAGVNAIVGDPALQEDLKRTVAQLPAIVESTQQTVAAAETTIRTMNGTLSNLDQATAPLAARSADIALRLDRSLANIEAVSADLLKISALLADEEGTLHRMAKDPALYENLNRSASSLAILIRNLEPILADMRVFSDKVARHPELLGVRGAISGSDGLKSTAEQTPTARRFQSPPQ